MSDKPTGTIAGLSDNFGDPETLLHSREWLRAALYAKGATYGGGSGCGCGQADIDVVIEGKRFNVSIHPLPDVFCEHALNKYTVNCPDCRGIRAIT